MPEDLRVDPERRWQSLMTMTEIGATSGGGVGHNERASAMARDLAAGADLLLHAIFARAGVAGSG